MAPRVLIYPCSKMGLCAYYKERVRCLEPFGVWVASTLRKVFVGF